MKKSTPQPLSKHPGRALLQALEDLETVEKNPKYAVDMDTWHAPAANGKCYVCLAGAVLANRYPIGNDNYIYRYPGGDSLTAGRTRALNYARNGEWCYYLNSFKLNITESIRKTLYSKLPYISWEEAEYQKNHRRSFKAKMRKAAKLMLKYIPEDK